MSEDKINFMIVDDYYYIAEITGYIISNRFPKSNVETFTDPLEAFAQLQKREKQYFIISDTDMPGMSGLELHDKALELTAFYAFILISGKDRYKQDADERGIDFMQKPIRFDDLCQTIEKHLNPSQQ